MLGSIEKGKYADLVVLSGDYMPSPMTASMNSQPVMTIVGGKVVFEAGNRTSSSVSCVSMALEQQLHPELQLPRRCDERRDASHAGQPRSGRVEQDDLDRSAERSSPG